MLVLLLAASSAFHLTHSRVQRYAPRPARVARDTSCGLFDCPKFNATKWVDDRFINFWQTSEETLDAKGGGDAGIAGATRVATALDGGTRAFEGGVRLLAAVWLLSSMGSPGASLLWLKATALTTISLPAGLRCLGDLVFKFRRAAWSIATQFPLCAPPSLLPNRVFPPSPTPGRHPRPPSLFIGRPPRSPDRAGTTPEVNNTGARNTNVIVELPDYKGLFVKASSTNVVQQLKDTVMHSLPAHNDGKFDLVCVCSQDKTLDMDTTLDALTCPTVFSRLYFPRVKVVPSSEGKVLAPA